MKFAVIGAVMALGVLVTGCAGQSREAVIAECRPIVAAEDAAIKAGEKVARNEKCVGFPELGYIGESSK